MKRKLPFAAAFISMLLLLVLFESALVRLTKANPIYQEGYLTIAIINSPENKTYPTSIIPLEIVTGDHQLPSTGFYRVDGGQFIKVNEDAWQSATFRGELNLTDGSHSVFVKTVTVGSACAVVYFTIDTIAPIILVQSPETIVYNMTGLSLNFTVDEPVSQVAYSLDGQTNVTVVGNTALANLTYGKHNVTVYAWDAAGNIGASKTIDFTVAEPFPTTLLISSIIAVVAVVGLGLLVYFKKRHRDKSP